MADDPFDSTVTDTEFDVIEEMGNALDDMDSALKRGETDAVTEKIAYLRFLLKDLGDILSGEYADLRRRRFITKGTK
ncbi:MAG: hypothetical protein P8175_08735 [Deltaproteobacteria bacterium]|jgi:hypothetical protein